MMYKLYIVLAVMVITFLAGLGTGYQLYRPHVPAPVAPAKEIVMHDSSIVIRRVTDTVFVPKFQKVPGSTVVTGGGFTVIPHHGDTLIDTTWLAPDTVLIVKTVNSDTVKVTYAFLKMTDGGVRVQVKATGGTIVDAFDVPKSYLPTYTELKNAAGIGAQFAPADGSTTLHGFFDRDVGPFVIGGFVTTQVNKWNNVGVGVRAGIRF